MSLNAETRNAVVTSLEKNSGAVLEQIAEQHKITTADVVSCLSANEASTIAGDNFEHVMMEISSWGEVTLLVNTGDLILEAKGSVPKGNTAHGYYNLHGKPIGGHLKGTNCASISFVSRKLFASDTHSVQFYNHDGGCMFKIYLGRTEERQLIPAQVRKFKEYQHMMAETHD